MNAPLPAAGQCLPLVRVLADAPEPHALFAALTDRGTRRDTLLLESGDRSTRQGEKSLLVTRAAVRLRCFGREVEAAALNPNGTGLLHWMKEQLAGTAAVVADEPGRLVLRFPPPPPGEDAARLLAPSPVDALRVLVRGQAVVGDQSSLGPILAGSFAYDLIDSYEALPPGKPALRTWPDFEFLLPDEMAWVNHRTHTTTVIAHVFGGPGAEAAYHDATASIRKAAAAVETLQIRGEAPEPPETPGEPDRPTPVADLSDEAYEDCVRTMKEHIVAGDVIQIVPSRTFTAPCERPFAAYRRLRAHNPSPYMFFLNGEHGVLFGASPETAVKVEGRPARVEIRPIAGTRPRGFTAGGEIDPDLDNRLEAELRLSAKEVAEHMMLLDLARNDVARVSRPGTRRVDRLLQVDRYSHVMHLVSRVSGELNAGMDGLHAYVAGMNMGTLVGAPKMKAAELLRRYEVDRRGPYGGAVGYLAHDGSLDTCIVIRSAWVRDGVALVRAGAGIVYDSDPAAEAAETRHKAEAVLKAIE